MVSLSIDPPPSAHKARSGPGPLRAVLVLVAVLGALGAGFWLGRVTAPGVRDRVADAAPAAAPAAVPAAPAAVPAPDPVAAAAAPVAPAEGVVAAVPAPVPAAPPAPVAAAPAPAQRLRLVATLSGSLEQSIAAALPPAERRLAQELTAVVNRLLVWDFQVNRDGRKGDRLEVLWTPPRPAAPGVPVFGEPVVEAVRYASSKLGTVLSAYRFQPEGERWPRYWRADGTELEARLLDGPIGDYEQVTSLLRDGRRHKGVDFKTPVGTPVFATFDGVIERRNWNFAGNGNCLDVRDPATGRHAIYLHLDVVSKEMNPGRRVKRGEVIAASGNSGRSYAPHLHYQLEDAAGRVLDPYEVHRVERRTLAATQRASFDATRAALDAALGATATATRAP
jgi:murein DD-endopeptidase MepM/ murein hydrolase activator NlpD